MTKCATNIVLLLCLQLFAGTALAGRLVSGNSYNAWSNYHVFENKAGACGNAKVDAASRARYPEKVERYSRCECDQNKNGTWECNVDARLENDAPERIVNGSSYNGWSNYHEFDNKADACSNAKTDASSKRVYPEQVESYSRCDCDQNNNGTWDCNVDARLEKH